MKNYTTLPSSKTNIIFTNISARIRLTKIINQVHFQLKNESTNDGKVKAATYEEDYYS